MSQFPHDEFVKEYLPELYQDYGEVTPSADVTSERRQIDVLFIPTKPVPTTPETLGLLGKLAQTTCLLEVYRNPVTAEQIRDCIGKLISIQQNQIKEAKREKRIIPERELPFLWIITPTISKGILKQFTATSKENWETGIYFLTSGLSTGIVAIHQLPITKNTLWLRILSRGNKQIKAMEELKALPSNYPHREIVLELVYGLLEKLEAKKQDKQETIEEDETLIMSLRQLYRDKMAEVEQKGLQQGIQQGIQQERLQLIIHQLKRKLGQLSPELESQVKSLSFLTLESLAEALLDFNSTNDLIDWLDNYSH
jgi:hypothetical protein